MADETSAPPQQPLPPPETVSAQPSWVGSTQDIIKALMQGQQPQQQSYATDHSEADLNPWLKALEQSTAPQPSELPLGGGQPPVAHMQTHELTNPANTRPPGKATSLTVAQATPLNQFPVSNILGMQQHQLSPGVQYAQDRAMKAIMQRAMPTAKG